MGGPWSLLASVNRESAYHDGTRPFCHFHHVNGAQARTRRMEWAVGRVQQEPGEGARQEVNKGVRAARMAGGRKDPRME